MPNFQEGSLATLAIIEEVTWGTTPTGAMLEIGFTSETLKRNKTKEKSEQISSNPYPTDYISLNKGCGGDINLEYYYGAEINLLLSHFLRANWAADVLQAGRLSESLTIRKVFYGADRNTVIDYTGCKVNTSSIVCNSEQGRVTGAFNVVGKAEIVRPDYLFFNEAVTPKDWLGRDQAIWVKSDTGVLYQWSTATQAWSAALTGDEGEGRILTPRVWTASAIAPSGLNPAVGDWHINTATGDFYYATDDSPERWSKRFTILPTGTVWSSGVIAPVDTDGEVDGLYIDTVGKKIYQKMDNGSVAANAGTWVQVMDLTLATTPMWYQGSTITAKTSADVFSSPQVRTLSFTNFDKAVCVKDLTLNINNNAMSQSGFCTTTSTYPSDNVVGSKHGSADIEVTANAYFSSIELYNKFVNDIRVGFSYVISDGTNQYAFSFAYAIPTEGSINTSGNNSDVTIPIKFMLIDGTDTPVKITKGAVA
jgi:hypothetical protein